MKALVFYDSFFGNTEKIAQAVTDVIKTKYETTLARSNTLSPSQLSEYDLLIAGSPTRAFRPTQDITKLLAGVPAGALKGKKAAVFDTRVSVAEVNNKLLTFMVKLFGYAAEPLAKILKRKGAELVIPPEWYTVTASEGPLKDGELERSVRWAAKILADVQ